MQQPRVLIADDEPMILAALTDFLSDEDWFVETASDGQEALQSLIVGHFDVAVLDIRMPILDGFEILDAMVGKQINTDVLILTAFGSVPRAVEAIHKGAKDFLQKPIQKDQLIQKVNDLLKARQPVTTHVLAERLDAYLLANLTDKDLTLEKLQNHFNLSRSYIWKLFKDLNTSFTERLTFHRVEKAKALLANTNEPIYIIAELCGFRNQKRLSEVIKREVGESPRQFRQRKRADE